jgi:hypothetical protein
MKPRVLNRRKHRLLCDCKDRCHKAFYVGRPGEFGNEFEIGKDGTREEVVAKHKAALLKDPVRMARVREVLKGKSVICWCAPKICHGDTLLEIANS